MLRRRFRGSKLPADLRLHLRIQTPRSHDDARRLRHDRRTEIAEGVSFRRRGNTDLCDHDHRYRRWFLLSVSNSFFPCGTASDEIAKEEIRPDVINSPKTAKKLDIHIAYFYSDEYNLYCKRASSGKKIRWRSPWKLSEMCILIGSS